MGWTYPYHTTTKASLIEQVHKNWIGYGTIHATKSVGKGYWILFTPPNGEHKMIGFYLMQKAQGLWGYKDMEEACGPFYYDCPIDWLAQAPVVNQKWRDGVIAHYAKKAEIKKAITKIEPNKTYKVNGSWKVLGHPVEQIFVTSVKPARGIFMGYTMKLSKKLMACMEPMA